MSWRLELGDSAEVLKSLEANSVDSIVTDPPAGVGFMGKDWDCFRRRHNPNDVGRDNVMGRMSAHAPHSYGESERDNFIAAMSVIFREALRVLKPGGHALVWALPRTSHWTAMALEEAGFEIRDICHHLFSTGFPKSQDVGKFIDKLAGAERGVVGVKPNKSKFEAGQGVSGFRQVGSPRGPYNGDRIDVPITAPATDDAKAWDGWGTALKPAAEHWILCRKPLSESSVARNVLKHGTGALNIDACRVQRDEADVPGWHKTGSTGRDGYLGTDTFKIRDMPPEEVQARCGGGRWPPDVLLSHDETCGFEDGACHPECPVAELNRQSGVSKGDRSTRTGSRGVKAASLAQGGGLMTDPVFTGYGDSGGASRFYPTFHYFAKPSRREREAGLQELPTRTLNRVNPGGIENDPRWAPVQVKNNHPTVKSVNLMTWLCTLITPPGGTVLDPFAGSGTTGCAAVKNGFSFIGIEQSLDYFEIARQRITYWEVETGRQLLLFGPYQKRTE